jgi:hypothetical protein
MVIAVSRLNPVPCKRRMYAVQFARLKTLPANRDDVTSDNGCDTCQGSEEFGRFQETLIPAPDGGAALRDTSMPILLNVATAIIPVVFWAEPIDAHDSTTIKNARSMFIGCSSGYQPGKGYYI